MRFVVDASVAVKWVVVEDDHDLARALIAARHDLIAPDFLLLEVGNVLWKKVRRKEISADQAGVALEGIRVLFGEIVPGQPHIARALSLALELDHSVYDCLYVAVAEHEGAQLVTADDRLLECLAPSAHAGLATRLGAAS